jgi:hypothetical protein
VNWEAISAIGQIVGAIAVVVSLIYLAREVHSKARATRQAAMRSTLDVVIRFTQQITAHADLAELRSRGFHDYESLEGTDLARFNSYAYAVSNRRGCVLSAFGRGISIHAGGVGSKRSSVRSTYVREFRPGGGHTRHRFGGEEFAKFINQLQQTAKPPPGFREAIPDQRFDQSLQLTCSMHVYEVRQRKDIVALI